MTGVARVLTLSFFLPLFVAAVFAADPASDATTSPAYPPKTKAQPVQETLHGTTITDPYRWLENGADPETQHWTAEQFALTRSMLAAQPSHGVVHARLNELLNIGTVGTPSVNADYYFYTRRESGQNQPILYVREGIGGTDRELVNANTMSADGTVALDWWYASEDGKYVAFGTSPGGSEISTLRLVETATGKLLDEKIDRCRAASMAWLPDNSGFYYTKLPRPGDVAPGQELYNRHVFFHQIGTNLDGLKDELVFGEGRSPQEWPGVDVSDDGRWLLVSAGVTFERVDLFLKDRKSGGDFKMIVGGKDFTYNAEIYQNNMYVQTNEGAPKFRVFKVSMDNPARENWKELLPESEGVLKGTRIVGGKLVAEYEKDANSRLKLYSLDGKFLRDIPLPSLGNVTGLGGSKKGSTVFYGFNSYTTPPSVYDFDLETEKSNAWAKVASNIDPSLYEVKQVFYPSKDGTKVPMFIVYKKGMKLTGKTPTLLFGYGGFNISHTPTFYPWLHLWLEHGGIFADANLRGGSEYGEEWHKAGMLEKKQNVFDDYIAAAEYLLAQKYTDRDHLGIYGRSNGGLLTGAALTQRPDLFRAVICGVPLLDMLRYQQFQIARLWIPEYGTAENPDQFKFIYAYSPYHHVKKTQYPGILFFASEGDTRVDPLHARKMTALLQASATNGPDRPILLRIEPKAGHGAGKPVSIQVAEWADIFTFLFWQLGVK
ncbi:MAG: S9 family peptidase [Acidobacteriales bacterium]|nr:S9 family peptidase [Terriglobales bacterium]